MALRIHIVCQNYRDDRIIPRQARALADGLGWSLSAGPDRTADVNYLLGYFEYQKLPRDWSGQLAANFTHREEEPPNNAKARLWDRVAERVQLRVTMAQMYWEILAPYGPTALVHQNLEREHFTLAKREKRPRLVCGFSGYTYANHRKGEDMVRRIIESEIGQRVEWRASGRGWPVPTKRYTWAQMPAFYQGLDVLVNTSRVEGGPLPPLEALACGVSVVIPRRVGLLDELPDLPGIYRYERGDLPTLLEALERAVTEREEVDREALREATEPWSLEAWVNDHARAFAETFGQTRTASVVTQAGPYKPPAKREPQGTRGIYTVAFGEPAKQAARELIATIRQHMPDIPIALAGAEPLGCEDIFIKQPDSDVGARRAKIRMYDLAPAEWDTVLYLDADTEVIAPIYPLFEWAEDGWELVITKDPHTVDTMQSYERRNNAGDMADTKRTLGSLDSLQLAGGMMCFRRGERVKAFFDAWLAEWEVHGQRDQGPLVRALYTHPLRVWTLGSQWNTFTRYLPIAESAGLVHYPGKARRWRGMIPGRTDSKEAWRMAETFERRWQEQRR